MSERGKRVIGALLATAALGLGLWVFWPRTAGVSPEPVSSEPALVGAEFSQARIVGRRRGERQWVVDAERLREEADEHVRAERIDSGTLYRNNEPYLDVSAAEALADQKSNDLVLQGDVVVIHVDGMILRTDRLDWHAEEERLIAPQAVEVERDGDRLSARRMELDWAEDVVYFYERVRMDRDTGHWLRAERMDYVLDTEDVRVRGSFRAGIPRTEAAAPTEEEQGDVDEGAAHGSAADEGAAQQHGTTP